MRSSGPPHLLHRCFSNGYSASHFAGAAPDMTLVQASAQTRSWLPALCDHLPHLAYRETTYWATLTSEASRRVLAQLNPQKRGIRLFLPLDPSDDPLLQPSPSTQHWQRWCSVFPIKSEHDLPTAARL